MDSKKKTKYYCKDGDLINIYLLNKMNIKFNNKITNIMICILLNEPDFYEDIEQILLFITNENEIKKECMHELLLLIKKIYECINKNNSKIKIKKEIEMINISGEILKIIIMLFIEKNKIKEKEKYMLSSKKIINSGIELMKLNFEIKTKKKSSFCFFN
jgi:hypothetical protein